jgi:hypothetical protein
VFLLKDGFLREVGESGAAWPVIALLVLPGAVLAYVGLRRASTGHAAAAAGALGFVLLASGGVVELAREEGVRLVDEYCAYGAVSDAQLDGCRGHVSADEVRSRRTPAAVFAVEVGECGEGAGPFCAAAVEQRGESDVE